MWQKHSVYKQTYTAAFKSAFHASMNTILYLLHFFFLPDARSSWLESAFHYVSKAIESDYGCTLETPGAVEQQREATGKPLLIYLDLKIAGVRDIPNQGGSFGIDLK